MLDFLKPSPPQKEIQDTNVVKKKYKYWRVRTFYSMYIGYTFYYFTRKSLAFAMPGLITDLGFDKAQLGWLATILSLAYGGSKFLSGIISDRSNPRYFMGIGLILTGFFNLFFGFSSTLPMFALFWGLNGWFQGWGWPPCAKLLTHWYSKSERGTWWSLWNTSHNIGGAAILFAGGMVAQYMGWRYVMYIPGIACIFIGLFLINRLRDTPRSLGLPTIETHRNDHTEAPEQEENEKVSAKEILFKYVLKNPYIWTLGFSYFFVYIVRTGINDWMAVFLVQSKGYSLVQAGTIASGFEIGGFFGSLLAGWSSDRLFKGRRGPVNILFSLLAGLMVFGMWKVPGGIWFVDAFFIFMIGFAIFGPQMLIGIAAAELSHKEAAGTSTGFVGAFAYAGAAVTGGPLGAMIDKYGWNGFYTILTVCAVMAVTLLMPLWKRQTSLVKQP
jgi:OPA family sugar phosphate sensor protein UhpC-like MFS transporter